MYNNTKWCHNYRESSLYGRYIGKKKHFLVYYPYCGWYDTLNSVTTIEKQVYMVGALTKKEVVSSIILIVVGIITLNNVTTIEKRVYIVEALTKGVSSHRLS